MCLSYLIISQNLAACCIKFSIKLGKSEIKIFEIIKKAVKDEAISRVDLIKYFVELLTRFNNFSN